MENLADADVFRRAWLDGLLPPEELTVTQWAERHRVLSGEGSIEPGPFRADKTPYVREILDSLHPDSGIRRVVWMKGSQIAGSETANNWIGYLIDCAPGAMMIVQPSIETARRYSRTRVAPMLRDSPRLAEIVPPNKSRDGDNTTFVKSFRGGVLLINGANSAAMLRSQPIRYLVEDEVDNWPLDVDGEGDPCKLAEARLRWSGARAKIYMLSSPKFKGSSRIEAAFQDGDQRRYFVPCPHCDYMQTLVWDNLKYEKGKPDTVMYECAGCASKISEGFKAEMLERGEWRATATAKDPGTRSYHLSSLYSPPGALSWADIVREFEEANDTGSAGLLQVWVNTILGETWEVKGEAPPAEILLNQARAEQYSSGDVPAGVLFLTAGVDVQKDRLECEVVGWGRAGESWSIEYFIWPGSHVLPLVWRNVDELLERTWRHAGGEDLGIGRLAVDAAYDQTEVAKWVRRKSPGQVMAVHGSERIPQLLGQAKRADVTRRGKAVKNGFVLWPLGVNHAKHNLYARLRLAPPVDKGEKHPPGFCHFPKDYGIEYFRQLTAEKLIFIETRTGGLKPEWHKTRPRNEALDCRVYATAAAAAYGIDRMREEHWLEHEQALGIAPTEANVQAPRKAKPSAPATSEPEQPTPPAPSSRPRSEGGWMSRWHGGPKRSTRR